MANKRSDEEQKIVNFVLGGIRTKSTEEIQKISRSLDVGLPEMIEKGLLAEQIEALPQDFLLNQIQEDELSIELLENTGVDEELITQLKVLTGVAAPEPTPEPIPVSEPTPEPFVSAAPIPQVNSTNDDIIDQIRENKVSLKEVRDALIENRLADHRLASELGYSSELIERIRNYEPQSAYTPPITELPPLRGESTDVYFLGMPGSGKSTMLASFLRHTNTKGMLKNVVNNTHGTKYKNQLMMGMSQGYLPDSTPTELINYIEVNLRSQEKKGTFHKLNFIDMAGEKFRSVAAGGMQNFRAIKDYLANDNRKCLIFVMDYFDSTASRALLEQDQNLQDVLAMLEDFGILAKTDFIYMIVTKADLFPSENKLVYADKYIDENYVNFSMACTEAKDKYSIQLKSFPYSIGPTILSYILEDCDPQTNLNLDDYPGLLAEQLMKDSHVTGKGFRFW